MTEEEAVARLGPRCRRIRVLPDGRGKPKVIGLKTGASTLERVLDAWIEGGRWWEGEQEVTFYRFVLDGPRIAEVMRDSDGGWWLVRMLD